MAVDGGGIASSVAAVRAGTTPRVMSPEDVLRMVRGSRLFSGLTEDEFREILSLLRTKTVSEGDLLLEVGGADANLYIVRKGRALIRSAEKSGKDPIIGMVEAGGMINE